MVTTGSYLKGVIGLSPCNERDSNPPVPLEWSRAFCAAAAVERVRSVR